MLIPLQLLTRRECHRSPALAGRCIAGAALLICLMTLAGCQSLRRGAKLPDIIRVQAAGEAPLTVAAPVSPRQNTTLTATGRATHDTEIAEPGQRVLLARAEARRTALRGLASAIQAENGAPFEPQTAREIAAILETETELSYQEQNGGSEATAQLNREKLGDRLPPAETNAATAAGSPDELAYAAALASAQEQLRDALLVLPVESNGASFGQRMHETPGLIAELDALILAAEPEEVEYPEPGRCRVIVPLDLRQARALARKH